MADMTLPVPAYDAKEARCDLIVKNTFLTVKESHTEHRRSSSVPSSARLGSPTVGRKERIDVWADCSTASEADLDLDRPESDTSSHCADTTSSGEASPAETTRTPLKSSARAWTPGALMSPTAGSMIPTFGPMGPMGMVSPMAMCHVLFMQRLTMVMNAAWSALAAYSHTYSVVASDGPAGCCLSARMRKEDVSKRPAALAIVKKALLHAAEASDNIFISGYEAKPFQTTPLGFEATVVMAPHPSEACWAILKQGFCSRGCQCRWKHPLEHKTFNLIIQVDP